MKDNRKIIRKIAHAIFAVAFMTAGQIIVNAQQAPPAPQQPPPVAPAPPEDAPEAPPEMMYPEPPLDPDDITVEDLGKASAIYMKVSELNQRLQQRLTGEQDQQVIQDAIAEAEGRLEAKADQVELELEDYDRIMQTVQQTEELLERFLGLVQPERPAVPDVPRDVPREEDAPPAPLEDAPEESPEMMYPEVQLDPDDITDEDLEKVFEIYTKVRELNQQLQQQLMGIIQTAQQTEELLDRFFGLTQPERPAVPDVPREEGAPPEMPPIQE